jgi:acyl-CoA hydrolase
MNHVYARRGLPFCVTDYPEATQRLIRERLRPLDDIIRGLPRRFRFYSTFAMSQARAFLRCLHTREDLEAVRYLCGLTLEAYPFLRDPKVEIRTAYMGPLDRLIAEKMGKTVAHVPRQFIQFCETLKQPGYLDFIVHTATPPDADGWCNLGLNCEILPALLGEFARTGQAKVILEINQNTPWVNGGEGASANRIHLTQVEAIYENHERLPQLPPITATEVEKRIAGHVLPYVEDGDTVQLGIGGVPNFIASQLAGRRGLRLHSEMLVDSMVDLVRAGAVSGRVVGSFAAGTDKLYDWIDRNPDVVLLPIQEVNSPEAIAAAGRVKSINSSLIADLNGQLASDAVGYQQISGIGGQLEFVIGAQRAPGGRSILCLKSTARVGGERVSNIVAALPAGTPVTVPRQYADVIVTEHGAAELRELDVVERAEALIRIAHPDFRAELTRAAEERGVAGRRPGFEHFHQRALYNNLGYVRRVLGDLEAHPEEKARILLHELRSLLGSRDLIDKLRQFYRQNR